MPTSPRPVKSPLLHNARELKKQYPATFQCPDDEDCKSVKVGTLVKVCIGLERFWAEVTAVKEGGLLEGRVDNDLVLTDRSVLKLDDKFQFCAANIYSIWEDPC